MKTKIRELLNFGLINIDKPARNFVFRGIGSLRSSALGRFARRRCIIKNLFEFENEIY